MNDLSNSRQTSDPRLPSKRKFPAILWVGVVLAVGAVVAVGGVIRSGNETALENGTGGAAQGEIPTQTPSLDSAPEASPSPPVPVPELLRNPPPPLQSEDLDADSAQMLLANYLEYADVFTAHPDQSAESYEVLGTIAGDLIVDELEAQVRELQADGWSRSGAPEIVAIEITEETPDSITAEVCLDSSDVQTRDFAGEVLPESKTPRAINIFVFEQTEDQAWRIVAHSFPDNPAC